MIQWFNFIMALNIMIKLVVLTQNIYLELDYHQKSWKGFGSFFKTLY